MAVNQEVNNIENLKNINTVPLAYYESPQDDEINLLDLWCVLLKRKTLFAVVLLLCVMLGLSYAMTRPQLFDFYTIIEIGSRFKNQEITHIEQPGSVIGKISSGYIPLVMADYIEKNPSIGGLPDIKVSLGKDSSIINLNIAGQSDYQSVYFDLLNGVINSIKKDHQRMFSVERNELEFSSNQVNSVILQLKEKNAQLVAQRGRLTEKAKLLAARVINTKRLIADAEKNKQQAMSNASSEAKVWVMMMVENDLRQASNLLADLEMQLHIDLDNEGGVLSNQITQNSRNQQEQQDQLARIQIQLDNLKQTNAFIGPIKSIKPVGKSSKLIVLVSAIGGLFMAVFLVFMFEFIEKARRYAAEKNQSV